MKNILLPILILLGALISETNDKPKIFIDCSYCDMNYIKTEIIFVNYVIERQAADIFIMIRTQRTGGGGEEYTIEFKGKNRFENMNNEIIFATGNDDTSDVIRQKMVKYLKLGLMQYVSKTGLSDKISIIYVEEGEKEEVKDEWDSWIFSIGGNGYFEGDAGYDSRNIHGFVNINRVTAEWLFRTSYFASNNFTNDRRYGYKDESKSQSADQTIVKSLTDHWSTGIVTGWNRSEYSNRENYFYLYPRIEYNIFPYSESSRRMLRIMYGIGANYSDYYDTTIFDKDEELRYKQSLEAALSVKKEWGNIYMSITGSTYLHDLEKRRFDSYAQISLRLFKGLALNLSGGYSMINDQIGLSAAGNTEEQILLRKREMETSFSYWSSVGLSYTFGSIYNNVVNPRLGN